PPLLRPPAEALRAGGRPIVAPVYRDGRGNPVLFASSVFDELRRVEGDRGGRPVIARDPERVAEVPVDAPMPADIDTPEDYEAARPGGPAPVVGRRAHCTMGGRGGPPTPHRPRSPHARGDPTHPGPDGRGCLHHRPGHLDGGAPGDDAAEAAPRRGPRGRR